MYEIATVLALAAIGTGDPVVVTASREPILQANVPASVFLLEPATLDALGLAVVSDLVRLAPGISVATTGPRGTQTQVRIRGAEANHSLLFVDGIRFNDPAAGNEARFELLTSDAASRIEVVRGPQSALWGSEALGGVIAIDSAGAAQTAGLTAGSEYGGLDSGRAYGQGIVAAGDFALVAAANWLRGDGIDSFGSGGERDGFETRGARFKAVFRPAGGEIGLVGHHVEGESDFDGFDPVTFRRADTRDRTLNRLSAIRGWGGIGTGAVRLMLDGSYLSSANRNRLGPTRLNSTFGDRFTVAGQLTYRANGHSLIAAGQRESESFRARDSAFFGGTDQDRSRALTALIGEWRAEWSDRLSTDVALRHDRFSAFADATTIRAGLIFRPTAAWTLHGTYGEGVAQPTFYDLFGFFPNSFRGNPALRPEHSTGLEAGVKWAGRQVGLGVTGFSNRLEDEIVDVFDSVTFLSSTANASWKSRRRGVEVEARLRAGGVDLQANYTYLEAGERQVAATSLVREVRRPRHSANLIADGSIGRLRLGGSLAYVGARRDTDFDLFPAERIRLGDYLLGSVQLSYQVARQVELYARLENALDADYQDVVGYNTAGRTAHAGLRFRLPG